MKIRSQQSSPAKPLLIAGGVILIAALGWAYYAHHYQKWPFLPKIAVEKPANTVDYTKPTSDQTSAGTAIKQQVADQAKSSTSSDSSTPSASSTAPASTVAMEITAANKTSDTLMVRTLIQTVTSTGSCILTMTGPNGGTYSASAGAQAMASTSTCKGFNVPLSELAHGTWTIKVNFKDGTVTGTATKEVSL